MRFNEFMNFCGENYEIMETFYEQNQKKKRLTSAL